ncbi:GDP-mannose-dependent alpha-(1-6)-phosphatidylinositol monomannoside mannosyltransferase [bacterium HR16]|nr:GDP-mannose-dependent alpha-(1-6)-phosphatidylinositol monomannoside mannosyltransferase [bacterium HR16]
MRVGINVHLLSTTHTGIQHYIRALVPEMATQATSHEIVLYGESAQLPVPAGEQVRWVPASRPLRSGAQRVLWEQTVLPRQLRRDGVDVFFSPAFVLPILWGGAGVVTVHDLNFEVSPETIHPVRRAYLRRITRWSAQRARKVIAISQSTASDIVRLYSVPSQKLVVIPYGLDAMFNPENARALEPMVRKRYSLPERFLLFVGTLEPRKNLPRLLEAYTLARRQANLPPLVLVGAPGWQHERILAQARRLGIERHILFAGYIPREHLPGVYAAASALLYPSLYEGFGLPPLEAMGCGTPVLASNTSAMPEVVGDGGILIDPRDVQKIADGILRITLDEMLRQQVIKRGLERAKLFRWDEVAEHTLRVLEEAYSPSSAR